MKRNALRQSFLITVTAAALAGPAACTNEVSVFSDDDEDDINPPACPVDQAEGSCSDEGLTCRYGPRCQRIAMVCADGTWTFDGSLPPARGCDCPATLPVQDEACANEGLRCGYGPDSCGFPEQEAECRDGTWDTWFNSCNPPPPFECPLELPLEGTNCDPSGWGTPGSCTYEEKTPCGTQEIQADCDWDANAQQMMWTVEAPSCSSGQCDTYGHKDLCDANSGCRWLVPGCGSGTDTVTPEGCYPIADCSEQSCDEGEACVTTVHNPCAFSLCGACGAKAEVCLPTPDSGG